MNLKVVPVYRGSALYPCRAKLAAVRLGLPKEDPPWLKQAAEEGKEHEQIIKRKLREEGWGIEDNEVCPKCQEMFGDIRSGYHYEIKFDGAMIVGHSDGRIGSPGVEKLQRLEVKSCSQFEFDRWVKGGFLEFPTYARQATAEWHGMSDCDRMLYIVKNRNLGTKTEDWLDGPPADIKVIKGDILAIEEWLRGTKPGMALESIPVEWKQYDPLSYECKRCPWQRALGCVKAITFGEVSKKILDEAARKWLDADTRKKEAEKEIESAKEVFLTATLAKELKGTPWTYGGCKIDYRHVKREGYEVKGTEFDQMTITRGKESREEI